MAKSVFIALEGLDCSGKTTVSRALAKKLGGATIFRFPDRSTPTGDVIGEFLKGDSLSCKINTHTLHMLYSANRYEKMESIREALKEGDVICDRYWISGTVYSVAKGLDMEWCASVDKMLPQPDYTFFLDADETVVASRPGFGEEVHDKVSFQKKVYEVYQRKEIADKMIKIDARRGSDEIVNDIYSIIRDDLVKGEIECGDVGYACPKMRL